MEKIVDYYFTPISPWTYLGHVRFGEIARRHGAAIRVKPVDYGRIFPVSGGLPLGKRAPQRQSYRLFELERWRKHLGVPLTIHPKFFPAPTELAARVILAAPEPAQFQLAGAVLRGVWAEEKDIADKATLRAIADGCGLDGVQLLSAAQTPEIAQLYDRFTNEAIELQVFGAPTYRYRDEPFWGQDRLDFLDRALAA